MTSTLDILKTHTRIVADTGDLTAIAKFCPIDATTNPSLITKAFSDDTHSDLLHQTKKMDTDAAIDFLTVHLGKKITELITGRISTEVDARLSFDAHATIQKAYEFINHYDKLGVPSERVLIKIASTCAGIAAARQLEKDGIHCNLTLLFTLEQAKSCADAGVTLISPFVGRITDWQKRTYQKDTVAINEDMGVQSVQAIYDFYKSHGYATQIMGASFRNPKQILALAGCDLLTISPALLDELFTMHQDAPRKLFALHTKDRPTGAFLLNDQQQAHPLNVLLHEGIEDFIQARQALAYKLSTLSHP